MLTIFAMPKAFNGHFGLIQHNAIASWVRLDPRPEIILFGDDEGTADTAREFGLQHVARVACNEYGTPLLSDIFEKAQDIATTDLVCYVNADIILMGDWMQAVAQVAELKRPFLMIGHRWDVDITEPIAFDPAWETKLRELTSTQGKQNGPWAIDFFVFPRHLLRSLPPFALGRTAWDNWILYNVRSRGIMLIDCTSVASVVHQNHDYSHHSKGYEGVFRGSEREKNIELAGGERHLFNLEDATYLLTAHSLHRALTYHHVFQQIRAVGAFHPRIALLVKFITKPMFILGSAYKQILFPKHG